MNDKFEFIVGLEKLFSMSDINDSHFDYGAEETLKHIPFENIANNKETAKKMIIDAAKYLLQDDDLK